MSYNSAFAPALAKYKRDVHALTWGHLAPLKNTSYSISILFVVSGYGNLGNTLIDSKLPENLKDSPWLYDSMNDYIEKFDLPDGVYLIKGTFRNFRWYGKPKNIETGI